MIVGYLLALAAAVASGTGSALEALGVHRAGPGATVPALRRQPLYVLGLCSDLLGFVCSASALQLLPLFLVQSTMALSVAVTAVIGFLLGTRLPTPGWIAIGIGALGLVMLGGAAQPAAAHPVPAGWHLAMIGVVFPVIGLAWVARRLPGSASAPLLAFAAAVALSVVSISARSLRVPDPGWLLLTEPAVWAIAANGITGVVVFAMALQHGTAVSVSAVLFTTTTTLPSVIGLVYLGDALRPGLAPLAALGFALAVGGAIGTAHFATPATAVRTAPRVAARHAEPAG